MAHVAVIVASPPLAARPRIVLVIVLIGLILVPCLGLGFPLGHFQRRVRVEVGGAVARRRREVGHSVVDWDVGHRLEMRRRSWARGEE